jgi:hypothetical protein
MKVQVRWLQQQVLRGLPCPGQAVERPAVVEVQPVVWVVVSAGQTRCDVPAVSPLSKIATVMPGASTPVGPAGGGARGSA